MFVGLAHGIYHHRGGKFVLAKWIGSSGDLIRIRCPSPIRYFLRVGLKKCVGCPNALSAASMTVSDSV